MARAKSIKFEMKQKLGSMEYFGHSKHELQQQTRQEQNRLMQEGVPFDERRRVDYCKDKVFSRNTMATYQGEISRYGDYLASQGLGKCGMDEAVSHIQEYLDYQSGRGLSPYSVHTTAAALCKTFGKNLQDYNVPKRELANITRGRFGAVHDKYNHANPIVQEVMKANTVLGLRRNELRTLTAGAFTDNVSTITMTTRGKGNKVNTCVFRNPSDISAVRSLIQGKQPGDRIFSADAFRNDVNYHASRAAAFQQRYQYYCDQMAKNPAAVIEYQQIIRDTFAAAGRECKEDLNKPYYCRGQHRACIEARGGTVVFSRTAVLMVATECHFRSDVLVQHYLTR